MTLRRPALYGAIVTLLSLVVVILLVTSGKDADKVQTTNDAYSSPVVVAVHAIEPDALPTDACIADLSCLRQYYQALTYQEGPQRALELLVEHSNRSGELERACHDTTHAIGETAAIIAPMAEAMALGDEDCGSGYYHGIIATMTVLVEPDQLAGVLNAQCAAGEQSFTRWECFHGVGHGFVFASNGDIYQGIRICEDIPDTNDMGACASGAFMQELVDNGDSDVYATDPYQVCRSMSNYTIAMQCYDMNANIVVLHRDTPAKHFAMCEDIPTEHTVDCYQGLGRARFAGMPFVGPEIERYCSEAGEGESLCLEGAIVNTAAYYGSAQEAEAHCIELSTETLQATCRQVLSTSGL